MDGIQVQGSCKREESQTCLSFPERSRGSRLKLNFRCKVMAKIQTPQYTKIGVLRRGSYGIPNIS